jgi:site-specific DNA-methyltransferase (adenine-specific)
MKNTLYHGDNLDVLRRHIADESVDLIYLDPPFKSDQNYNVLFQEQNGSRSAAQIRAFEDTWQWDQVAAAAYQEVVEAGGQVSLAMQAFRTIAGASDILAYLSMMAPRLKELHRVLKPTGSIYLHCDPTASHYLKLLLDAVFGGANFRNEIAWCYYIGGRISKHAYGRRHDIILFYSKSDNYIFNWESILLPWSEKGAAKFKFSDEKGKYRLMGRFLKDSPIKGHRDVSPEWEITNPELVYRHYQKKGRMCLDYWNIPPINQASKERLGYPTQKPEALLQRIIQASSKEENIVLDPFCGCGTAIAAAQKLNRHWIGIDITHIAITLIKHRLANAFGNDIKDKYEVIGEPVDLSGAKQLAAEDPYQFQWWALGLVNARPVEQKKGADKGIDGRIFFHDDAESQKTKQIIISVKSGNVQVSHVRDLRGVVERENVAIGLLICLHEPTRPMRTEAAGAGFYESPWRTKHPKIQILTIEELLTGKTVDIPPSRDIRTFKKAPKAKKNPSSGIQNLFVF